MPLQSKQRQSARGANCCKIVQKSIAGRCQPGLTHDQIANVGGTRVYPAWTAASDGQTDTERFCFSRGKLRKALFGMKCGLVVGFQASHFV